MKLGRRMMAVVSIVVIAASVMVIALRQFNRSDTVNLDPFAAAPASGPVESHEAILPEVPPEIVSAMVAEPPNSEL